MSVIYYITFLPCYHASLGYRDSLSINALFAQTSPSSRVHSHGPKPGDPAKAQAGLARGEPYYIHVDTDT